MLILSSSKVFIS